MRSGARCELTWPALVSKLEAKLDTPNDNSSGWAPTTFGERRAKEEVEAVHAIGIDFDDGELSLDEAVELWKHHLGVVHTTRHHSPELPKLRVVLALDRQVTLAEHASILSRLRSDAAGAGFPSDNKPTDASRLWFYPGACPGCDKCGGRGAPREAQRLVALGGVPLDVEAILERLAIEEEPLSSPASSVVDAPSTVPRPAPSVPGPRVERRLRGLLDHYLDRVRSQPKGDRNDTMSRVAYDLGGFAHHGLDEATVVRELVSAAREGSWSAEYLHRHEATARRQFRKGAEAPRDLPADEVVASEDKPTTIDEVWAPLEEDFLSRRPLPRRWFLRYPAPGGAPGAG
ncbi:MAG: hypothetical protein KC731_36105, partial [Myxococcales bacterium]|nr:hypothetical protein [Myxococcales bacterium]